MTNEGPSVENAFANTEHQPHRVRIPRFVSDDDIGLGDVVTRATSVLGIKACEGCERRAAALNRWMVFSSRHSR